MSLRMLKDVKEIGGFPVLHFPEEKRKKHNMDTTPILIDHDDNYISFKLQSAPIKEVGVNGCQVETLIEAARLILEGFDKEVPHHFNDQAIIALTTALAYLGERTKERKARGVEGTSAR